MKLYLKYHNNNHRGPGAVVRNLLLGLSGLDIEIVKDISRADVVGCLQHPGNDFNKLPVNTLMGPNIFVLPNEEPEIWGGFNNFVVPSLWVKDLYSSFDTDKNKLLNVWPVGIDTEQWKPSLEKPKDKFCFIYYKNRPREDLLKVARTLRKHGYDFRIINYGSYDESDLKDLCKQAKFAVLLTDTESQGIAYMNILSTNTPCMVWNKPEWEYNGQKHPATSVPYFDNACGVVADTHEEFESQFTNFTNGSYSPRDYINNNFSLQKQAQDYINILKSIGDKT